MQTACCSMKMENLRKKYWINKEEGCGKSAVFFAFVLENKGTLRNLKMLKFMEYFMKQVIMLILWVEKLDISAFFL